MTIKEIMDLCIDSSLCQVEIFNLNTDKSIYNGMGDEIPEHLEDLEVGSFDVPSDGKMTFNIY